MTTSNTKKSVLVGVSGGVDSTVCCRLLLDAGYVVQGIYCVMSDAHLQGVDAAKQSAAELSIPLEILDIRDAFCTHVIRPFMEQYCDGKTPNPCVVCNPLIKFKSLIDTADRLKIDYIATGHYARVAERGGFFLLKKSADPLRDQSYMLYRLPQGILSRLLLPLGEYHKDTVRSISRQNSYSSSTAPDSQEICFIPDSNYPEYIHAHGFFGKKGNFISPDGDALGAHKGVEYYTVGQRKGLNLSLGQPVFVKKILEDGNIRLAYSGDEYADSVTVKNCTVNPFFDLKNCGDLSVKLRSMSKAVRCGARYIGGNVICLEFDERQRAPAPGQSAVLYCGDLLVGGGIIFSLQ